MLKMLILKLKSRLNLVICYSNKFICLTVKDTRVKLFNLKIINYCPALLYKRKSLQIKGNEGYSCGY